MIRTLFKMSTKMVQVQLKGSWNDPETLVKTICFCCCNFRRSIKSFCSKLIQKINALLSYSPNEKKIKKRKSQRPKILHEIFVSNYHGNSLIPVSDPKIIFSRTFCCCEFLEQLTECLSGNFPFQNLFRSSKEWWWWLFSFLMNLFAM